MENLTPELKRELFPDNLVLTAYRGSIAHNMYVPNTDPDSIDDIDLMGVYMAPKEYYIGLGLEKKHEKAVEHFVGKYDVVSYEFRKFVNLLLKSNPNVLSMLWLKDEHYLSKTEAGQLLIDNRDLFSSLRADNAFVGYAIGQLKKMNHCACQGYQGAKRKALVEKFGFDSKAAAHCIRLLRMGLEFITTGALNVHRHDATELLEIKLGKWTKDAIDKEATKLINKFDTVKHKSPLPTNPNIFAVESLVVDVMLKHVTVCN